MVCLMHLTLSMVTLLCTLHLASRIFYPCYFLFYVNIYLKRSTVSVKRLMSYAVAMSKVMYIAYVKSDWPSLHTHCSMSAFMWGHVTVSCRRPISISVTVVWPWMLHLRLLQFLSNVYRCFCWIVVSIATLMYITYSHYDKQCLCCCFPWKMGAVSMTKQVLWSVSLTILMHIAVSIATQV